MLGKPQIQMQNTFALQDTMLGICVARNQRRVCVTDRSDYRNTSTELTGVYWKGRVLLVNKEPHSFETDPHALPEIYTQETSGSKAQLSGKAKRGRRQQ